MRRTGDMDIEITESPVEGYVPLVHSGGWRVAVINSCERLLEKNRDRVERHMLTDEVFVLLSGKATLIVGDDRKRYVLEEGKVYNVKRGAWHTIALERGSKVLVVENDDTSPENTGYSAI